MTTREREENAEKLDKKIALRKECITCDSFARVIPASKYLLLDQSEQEELLTDLRAAADAKSTFIEDYRLARDAYITTLVAKSRMVLEAVNANIATIVTMLVQQ